MINKQDYNLYKPEFEVQKSKLTEFITTFIDKSIVTEDDLHEKKKYMIELQKIANQTSKLLEIHLEDLEYYFSNEAWFFDLIKTNTKRYVNFLYEIIDKVMPRRTLKISSEEDLEPFEEVIQNQRMANLLAKDGNGDNKQVMRDQIPSELLRRL